MMPRTVHEPGVRESATFDGAGMMLDDALAVVVRGAARRSTCAWLAGRVLAARAAWSRDFGGDQYCLGRAFYTHFETDRTREYFDDADASNARVERALPGLQARLRTMVAEAVAGRVVPRPGWCGAGVHVFPRGKSVATRGGAIHFDTEGLSDAHVARRKRAVSLVLMLQPPSTGGGLRLWRLRYDGEEHVDPRARDRAGSARVALQAGDAVLFDSYRLHQIEPFTGARHRLSASLHAAELDDRLWEAWF